MIAKLEIIDSLNKQLANYQQRTKKFFTTFAIVMAVLAVVPSVYFYQDFLSTKRNLTRRNKAKLEDIKSAYSSSPDKREELVKKSKYQLSGTIRTYQREFHRRLGWVLAAVLFIAFFPGFTFLAQGNYSKQIKNLIKVIEEEPHRVVWIFQRKTKYKLKGFSRAGIFGLVMGIVLAIGFVNLLPSKFIMIKLDDKRFFMIKVFEDKKSSKFQFNFLILLTKFFSKATIGWNSELEKKYNQNPASLKKG